MVELGPYDSNHFLESLTPEQSTSLSHWVSVDRI